LDNIMPKYLPDVFESATNISINQILLVFAWLLDDN
jgi:hypothetical protein